MFIVPLSQRLPSPIWAAFPTSFIRHTGSGDFVSPLPHILSSPLPLRLRPFTMSLSRLATVELQLVMHCCDRRSLLTLARCSRSILRAARDDFAWRLLSPIVVPEAAGALRPELEQSLLRFCDVSVEWSSCPSFDIESELRLCASLPRLRSLRMDRARWSMSREPGFECTLPCLDAFLRQQEADGFPMLHTFGTAATELHTGGYLPRLATLQPKLRSITLPAPPSFNAQFAEGLLQLFLLLNSFEILFGLGNRSTNFLASLAATMGQPLLDAMQWEGARMVLPLSIRLQRIDSSTAVETTTMHASAASPAPMAFQLQHLDLHSCGSVDHVLVVSEAHREKLISLWRCAFDSLPSLRSLHVHQSSISTHVLTGLLHSSHSSLRALLLRPELLRSDARFIQAFGGPSVAPSSLIEQLLAAKPGLREVQLVILSQQAFARRFQALTDNWTRTTSEWAALRVRWPERIWVRFEEK